MNRQQRRAAKAVERTPSKEGTRPRHTTKPPRSITLKSGRGRANVK